MDCGSGDEEELKTAAWTGHAPCPGCTYTGAGMSIAGFGIRGFGRREVDGAPRNDGGDGVLVDHLGDRVAQQHDILVERFDLPLQLDTVDQVDGNRHVLAAQCVQEGVLKKLTFVAHDILRVQEYCCKAAPYHSLPSPRTKSGH